MYIQDSRPSTTTTAIVDPTTKALRASVRPAEGDGQYRVACRSGAIAAGTNPGILFSFRYQGSGICVIQSIRISLNQIAAYTQGNIGLSLYLTRAFLTSDVTGGTLIVLGNSNKMRDQQISSQVAAYITTTGLLTGGTGVDELFPYSGVVLNCPTPITGQSPQSLISMSPGSHPLRLTLNEGFRIRNENVTPANGTSQLVVNIEWVELPADATVSY